MAGGRVVALTRRVATQAGAPAVAVSHAIHARRIGPGRGGLASAPTGIAVGDAAGAGILAVVRSLAFDAAPLADANGRHRRARHLLEQRPLVIADDRGVSVTGRLTGRADIAVGRLGVTQAWTARLDHVQRGLIRVAELERVPFTHVLARRAGAIGAIASRRIAQAGRIARLGRFVTIPKRRASHQGRPVACEPVWGPRGAHGARSRWLAKLAVPGAGAHGHAFHKAALTALVHGAVPVAYRLTSTALTDRRHRLTTGNLCAFRHDANVAFGTRVGGHPSATHAQLALTGRSTATHCAVGGTGLDQRSPRLGLGPHVRAWVQGGGGRITSRGPLHPCARGTAERRPRHRPGSTGLTRPQGTVRPDLDNVARVGGQFHVGHRFARAHQERSQQPRDQARTGRCHDPTRRPGSHWSRPTNHLSPLWIKSPPPAHRTVNAGERACVPSPPDSRSSLLGNPPTGGPQPWRDDPD